MTGPAASPIEAAGGVLWRDHEGQELVALVHRPAYDDWSLPKGKARRGEHPVLVALREVKEETGWSAHVGVPLADQRYDKEGRPKVVHLHAMHARHGEPLDPDVEVDALRWLPPSEAAAFATYERDRLALERFVACARPTRALVVLRHAGAGERAKWGRPDVLRPLDDSGTEQASLLAELLAAFGPTRLLSSPAVRCTQTVEPLAERLGLPVEQAPEVAEDGYDAEAATELLLGLVASGPAAVVCTHGPVVNDLLERTLAGLGLPPTGSPQVPKGAAWVLHVDASGAVAALERLPAP